MPNVPTSITIELPTKEYRIVNGPPEKMYMFSVFKDIERGGPPFVFKVLDDEGKEHDIYAYVHLASRDTANQHDHEKYAACYYLAGVKLSQRDFLGTNMWFVAIFSVPKRTGRWIVIPEGALPFVLPGNYILDYLDRVEKPPIPPAAAPSNKLKGAEGKKVRLFLKWGTDTIQGVVNHVGETSVEIKDGSVIYIKELADINEVIFVD